MGGLDQGPGIGIHNNPSLFKLDGEANLSEVQRFNSLAEEGRGAPVGVSQDRELHGRILARLFQGVLGDSFLKLAYSHQFDLRDTFQSLSSAQKETLIQKFGKANLGQFFELSREDSSSFFFPRLLSLAKKLRGQNQPELGFAIIKAGLDSLEHNTQFKTNSSQNWATQYRRELKVFQGRGSFGQKFEEFTDLFVSHLMDPIQWAGFGAGISAFNLTRFAVLGSLLGKSAKATVPYVLGSRLMAFSTGVITESAAFNLTTRGLRQWTGGSGENPDDTFKESVLGTAIGFGSLRLGGAFSKGLLRSRYGIKPWMPLEKAPQLRGFSRAGVLLVPQISMLGALMAGTQVSSSWGLQAQQDFSSLLGSSLAALVHLNSFGYLFHRLSPPSFQRWAQTLEVHSELMLREAWRPLKQSWVRQTEGFSLNNMSEFTFPGGFLLSRKDPGLTGIRVLMAAEKDPESGGLPPPPGASMVRMRRPPIEEFEMLDEFPMPVVILNSQGRILYRNGLIAGFFGESTPDLLGQKFSNQFNPVKEGSNIYKIVSSHGKTVFFEAHPRAFPNREDLTLYYFHDVTELRGLRERKGLVDLRARLNHDVNNMLTAIFAYRDVAFDPLVRFYEREGRDEPRYGRQMDYIRRMGDALQEASRLVDISRQLERGSQQPGGRVNLSEIFPRSLKILERQQLETNIRPRTQIEPGLWVEGNEAFLMASMVNLIRNAYDAMRNDGGELLIRARREYSEIWVEISDTGSGIPPEARANIFQDGFTTKSDGTGHGLANVRAAIEEGHGGRVQLVDPEPGMTTTFRIRLPDPEVPILP